MVDSQPLVSAIIPTHNRSDLLPRALQSVIDQTYQPLEIIVVDDASTDDTGKVVRDFQKTQDIRYLKNETSLGAAETRNRGVREAKGMFIAGLDDDDEWHPDRLEKMMKADEKKYAFVTSDNLMKFPNGEAVWHKEKVIDLDTLLYTNQVGNQILIRRDRMLQVGGFDTALEAVEDYDLWIRLCAAFGPVRNVQEPLQTIYMDHEKDRITDRSFKGYLQFYNKNKHRFNRLQRKYQLFHMRRLQRKPLSVREFISCIPSFRYWDEFKNVIAKKFLG